MSSQSLKATSRDEGALARLTASPGTALIEVRNLVKIYPAGRSGLLGKSRVLRAVDGVSFAVHRGESVGLVGESGSGKSTIAKLILGLERPSDGSALFEGTDVTSLRASARRLYRKSIQAVFQDPAASLDSRMRIAPIVLEAARVSRRDRHERVAELLSQVGLLPELAKRFPHELSGGQRQRVAIARALASSPDLLVLDEPVSSLDVSIRAQVINLLKDLQAISDMAYLLIAHDLATVRYLCQRVIVLHLGQVVEEADAPSLFAHPRHPYTQALLSATLPTRPGVESDEIILHGDVASPINPPSGCRFRERCPFARGRCAREAPPLRPFSEEQLVACHFAEEIAAGTAERTNA